MDNLQMLLEKEKLKKIFRYLLWQYYRIRKLRSVLLENDGFNLVLPISSGSASVVFTFGRTEPMVAKEMQKSLRRGGVFVDVGAHVGEFTFLARKIVGEYGQIFSFEPDPRVFWALEESIKMNKFKNVVAEKKIVSDQNKNIFFLLKRELSHSSIFYGKAKGKKIKSSSISLDKYFGNKKVDLIKIDVEGAELRVMHGAVKIIGNCHPTLIFEFGHYKRFGYELDDIIRFLQPLGYSRFYKIDDNNMVAK